MLGDLFTPVETPEAQNRGFLKGLFGGSGQAFDREELCKWLFFFSFQSLVHGISCSYHLGMEWYIRLLWLVVKNKKKRKKGRVLGYLSCDHFTSTASFKQWRGGGAQLHRNGQVQRAKSSTWHPHKASLLQGCSSGARSTNSTTASDSFPVSISPLQLVRPQQEKPLAVLPSTYLDQEELKAWEEPQEELLGTWLVHALPLMSEDRNWESWMKGLRAWWPVQKHFPNMHMR